jgi:2,4-dienoyl-CoA reductase-like NADH-dependent reductase (Old Yellow Enzyme family)
MTKIFDPLTFKRGPAMKNRFMLAPMTNWQSNDDGTLAEEEYRWLTMRAQGGFGATMTCGANVAPAGRGFPGNLGAYSDRHIAGLRRLASGIREANSVAFLQLFHAGARAPTELTGITPIGPSDDAAAGVRGMSGGEVAQMVEDFIAAAVRAETAGFDGVELHGAHGYLLCAFLSTELNTRGDRYGGSLENRARPIREIIAGIRERCGPDFSLGLRLSSERFGIRLAEMRELAQSIMAQGAIDYLDISLWDAFKDPAEEEYQGRPLISYFTDLDRNGVRLGVAGNIVNAVDAKKCLAAGADFVLIGRAGILHHDFPKRVEADPQFRSSAFEDVTMDQLEAEGVSKVFRDYLFSMKRPAS